MRDDNRSPKPAQKNQRPCPALGGTISPADCGAQRGSKLSCPPICPFLPFGAAAPELWEKVGEAWADKVFAFIHARLGQSRLNQVLRENMVYSTDKSAAEHFTFTHTLLFELFFRPDASGKLLADHWEAGGWRDLNNDERVLMKHRRQSLATVIEIQKIRSDGSLSCVDLFAAEPVPFVLFDPPLAQRAARFTRLLLWLTPFPNFTRVASPGFYLEPDIWPIWRQLVLTRYEAARASQPDLASGQYLAQNLPACANLIAAVRQEWRQRVMANMDLGHQMAVYNLEGKPDEIEALLKNKPDFRPIEPRATPGFPRPWRCYDWVPLGESATLVKDSANDPNVPDSVSSADAPATLGLVRLYQDTLIIESLSKENHAFARRLMERDGGARLKFHEEFTLDPFKIAALSQEAERTVREAEQHLGYAAAEEDAPNLAGAATGNFPDTASARAPTASPAAATPAPPGAGQPSEEDRRRQFFERFLSETQPALNGLTPRAAAQDPAVRSQLVDLMKRYLHQLDLDNQRSGHQANLDWVLEELNLTELK